MKLAPLLLLSCLTCLPLLAAEETPGDWQRALPGLAYQFPTDHGAHPDYKTEWWYFTGNLKTSDGEEFGYELTFFRQGVLPPGAARQGGGERSRFVQHDFKFAHFAVTDLQKGKFHYTQKLSRGAFGEAGNLPTPLGKFVWLEDWSLTVENDGTWHIRATAKEPTAMRLDLRLAAQKPPVIEGTDGVSQKAAGEGNASHYYSFTRLRSEGMLSLGTHGDKELAVRGESWFDHEWASNQLGADQIGWNWFCIQLDDGAELMLYAMRRKDGSIDPVSSGTYINPDGTSRHLRREDFTMQPGPTWRSPRTGAVYPVAWQIELPAERLKLNVRARLDEQELFLPQISYWEGSTGITGTRGGKPVAGLGYMELTGYAGQLSGLQQTPRTGSEANLRTTTR